MSGEKSAEKKFHILSQINRASHFAWRRAALKACPDIDPLELVKIYWAEVGHDTARAYIKQFKKHLEDLNILPATIYPRATQEIDQIIKIVEGLIEKDHAYEANGDVYFFVSSDDDYGKLSGRKIEDMRSGFRIDVDDRKETPMDFALWKASKPGEPAWDSPWGPGRPGW